ncbi:MAG: site-2 protease family protein [Armatimonadota bacterium]|nr:site-2 protease family protein [Armatimonadota bacterium]
MGGGFRLGRLVGIPIFIHSSWFIALWVLSWSLAVAYYPQEFPGLLSPTYWAMGIISALLLFGSVLVHELGHALIARRHGVRTRNITLFMFGGVAQIAAEPPTAEAELAIAAAGPLTSYGLAGLLWVGGRLAAGTALGAMVSYLAFINLLLATFNLIPGFPLDGGRMLRAWLWRRGGDLERATRTAAQGGQVVAVLFIGLGLVQIFRGAFVGGLWLVLIGWFLQAAAQAGYQQVLLRRALGGVRVGEIMTRDLHTIDPNLTVEEAIAEYFIPLKHGGFPVVYGERLLGVVTLQDVRAVPREARGERRVRDVMTPSASLKTVRPSTSAYQAFTCMGQEQIGRLLVTDEAGSLVGIITRSDLLHVIRVYTEFGDLGEEKPARPR